MCDLKGQEVHRKSIRQPFSFCVSLYLLRPSFCARLLGLHQPAVFAKVQDLEEHEAIHRSSQDEASHHCSPRAFSHARKYANNGADEKQKRGKQTELACLALYKLRYMLSTALLNRSDCSRMKTFN
jgi:hypothetical protein